MTIESSLKSCLYTKLDGPCQSQRTLTIGWNIKICACIVLSFKIQYNLRLCWLLLFPLDWGTLDPFVSCSWDRDPMEPSMMLIFASEGGPMTWRCCGKDTGMKLLSSTSSSSSSGGGYIEYPPPVPLTWLMNSDTDSATLTSSLSTALCLVSPIRSLYFFLILRRCRLWPVCWLNSCLKFI